MFKEKRFLLLFICIVLANLTVGSSSPSHFRIITKPLILISLLFYFRENGKGLPKLTYGIMSLALFFSLLGDLLLLFDHFAGIYFVLGLVSFLITQVLYCAVFLKKGGRKNSFDFFLVILLLVFYGIMLFLILKEQLGTLKIPVTIYILAILSMAITAYGRKENVNAISFNTVFIGALLFILSDSVLALNRFMLTIPLSHFLIIGSYAAAQYLITKGILQENKN